MLHYAPQHVSSSTLLIIRRTNCITTAYLVYNVYLMIDKISERKVSFILSKLVLRFKM